MINASEVTTEGGIEMRLLLLLLSIFSGHPTRAKLHSVYYIYYYMLIFVLGSISSPPDNPWHISRYADYCNALFTCCTNVSVDLDRAY